MKRMHKALIVAFVASFGLWGCAQGPTNGPASLERLRALETKNTKLEEDFRAAAATRDQLRKKLTEVEAQREQQAGQLQVLHKERDDLQRQLTARTGERDTAMTQYEDFRKNIRDLLGRAEAKLPGQPELPVPTVTAAAPAVPADTPQ